MKGIAPLFLGIFATFAFSWVGLALIPNYQIGRLDPQTDEEGADAYPVPKSGMAERGRQIYAANGCMYCHSQQVRADYAASDIERKWGVRRSAPRDYIFERPALLGKTRMGPDLSNIGKRAPSDDQNAPSPASTDPAATSPAPAPGASPAASPPATAAAPPATSPVASPAASPASSPAQALAANSPAPTNATTASVPPPSANSAATAATTADTTVGPSGAPIPYSAPWHHLHLYSPRSITLDSNMPAYHFLYEKRRVSGERSADALKVTGPDAPEDEWEIVPTFDAKCLVAYIMSLDQSHELKEAKSTAVAASSPAPAASPAPATSPDPAKEAK